MENYKANKYENNSNNSSNSRSTSYNPNMINSFSHKPNSIKTPSGSQSIGNKIGNIKNGVQGAKDIAKNLKSGDSEPLNENNVSKLADGLSETNIPYVSQGAKVVKGIDKITGGKASKTISKAGNKAVKRTKLKLKIMISLWIIGFSMIFLIFFVVFADQNEINMGLTNNTSMSSKSGGLSISQINSRIVYIDIDNLVTNDNVENAIYVINIIDGFSLEEINNLINTFITTNSIEDYFITNSSISINDSDLYSLFDNRLIDKNNVPQSIINSGLVKSVGVGEAATINLSDRMSWLFPLGIPNSRSEMENYLTTISVEVSDQSGNISTKTLTLHKQIASEVEAIFSEMAAIKFPIKDAYAYSWRGMASNAKNRSHHSYGVAIDINANSNPAVYWGYSPNKSDPYYINQTVVEIWKKHGFYWGGDWSKNYYDPMHFTYTNH